MIIEIYDDEQIYLENMNLLCRQYAERTGTSCEIYLFHSEKELLKNNEKLDVLFLDIRLNGLNGLDIQELLWQRNENSCFIVYMTNYSEYANEAYNINVIGFLNKPVTYDMAERVLNKAKRNKEELNILFEYAGKSVRSRDILYLKASSPFVKIYFLSGNNIPERSKIQEWMEKLKEYGFFRIHYSYIINMAYVQKYTKQYVIIYKMIKIPISRRRYKEFEKAYEEYLEKRRERR